MAERETKTISTLSGKQVVVKAYLSAREMQEINSLVLGDQKSEGGEGSKISFTYASAAEWEKKILEKAIVSVEGATDKPLDTVLDLSNEEYNDLKTKIWEVLKINLKQTK